MLLLLQEKEHAQEKKEHAQENKEEQDKALRTWDRCCWTWDLGLLLDLGTGIAPGSEIDVGDKDLGSLLEVRTWEHLGPGRMEEKQGQAEKQGRAGRRWPGERAGDGLADGGRRRWGYRFKLGATM